jgi:hypothetical protein
MLGGTRHDMPFDLCRVIGGLFKPFLEGGGMSVVSVGLPSKVLSWAELDRLVQPGWVMLNVDKFRIDSTSASSSDDSTGVRVGGIVQGPICCNWGFGLMFLLGGGLGDSRRGRHCFLKGQCQPLSDDQQPAYANLSNTSNCKSILVVAIERSRALRRSHEQLQF